MKRAKSPERMAEVPAMTKGSHPPRCRDNGDEIRKRVGWGGVGENACVYSQFTGTAPPHHQAVGTEVKSMEQCELIKIDIRDEVTTRSEWT